MNGSSTFARELVQGLQEALGGAVPAHGAELVLFPPALYLDFVRSLTLDTGIGLGVQNVHPEPSGAFTGELAAEMAAELGADFVLVGHSERRELFGEDDAQVASKFVAVQRAGLSPVLCVGERLEHRESGRAESTVLSQLDVVLDRAGSASFGRAVVAYEPVWAIGTGRTAQPEDAQTMHAAIRAHVAAADPDVAEGLRILYGGSVKANNAAALFAQADIDGGLVGGAALDLDQFAAIYDAAIA